MNHLFLLLILLSMPVCHAASGKATVTPVFGPPPRLAITGEELAALKASPDFISRRDAAIKEAESLLADPPPLPDGFGSWTFYYANPETGGRLVPLSPTEHKDPATGEIFRDERTVAAYRGRMHARLDAASLKLGWAYAFTGDSRYAEGVRRILLKLAADYPDYPKRQDRWGRKGWFAPLGGRRYVQSLDEAVGVIKLAKAYDLTRTADVYSDQDREKIEGDFFRLTADTLLWFNQDINNHQTWYDAGLMCIASVLEDAKLVNTVLTMRGGFYDQVKRSIGEDGLWYEGSMAYHRYALQALIEQVDAARRLGISLQDEPKFKKLFTAPLHAAYPDGKFPAINDSDPSDISSFNGAWRWAWKTYKEPLFARALAKEDEKKLKEMLGPDAKVEWPLPLKSEVLADSGLAILRMGEGEGSVCVFLDFGPHGGGHGHFDKLNLLLFAKGREWLLDPGRLTYSHKEYKTWVKTTAAHNTVALNESNQRPAEGRLLYMRDEPGFAAAGIECTGAYAQTVLRRHVLITPKLLVDVFDVQTMPGSRIDLFAHASADSLLPVVPANPASKPIKPGSRDGYQHLSHGLLWSIRANSTWDYIWKDQRLRVLLAADPDEELITCEGIGFTTRQATPTLIRRRKAGATRFVAVYDLTKDTHFVLGVSRSENQVAIKTANGSMTFTFDETGVKAGQDAIVALENN